jgi:hypothetical protein
LLNGHCTLISPLRGNAVLCPDSKYLFVTNLVDGIDQYSFPTLEHVQKFSHPIIRNVPLQVAIVQNATFIVSGGDDGMVRLFERRNGQLLTCLQHGDENELVQTVAVSDVLSLFSLCLIPIANQTAWDAMSCTIATASSAEGPGVIKVWVNSFDVVSALLLLNDPNRNSSKQIAIQEDERLSQTNALSVWSIFVVVFLTSVVVTAANMYLPSSSHFGNDFQRCFRVLGLI